MNNKIDYRPLDEWRKYYGIYYKGMAREVNVTPHDIGELFYTRLEA